jgi:hypothetical protein
MTPVICSFRFGSLYGSKLPDALSKRKSGPDVEAQTTPETSVKTLVTETLDK